MRSGLSRTTTAALAAAVAVAAMTVAAPRVSAQDDIDPINNGAWSFSLGADIVTEYWFRGIAQGPANTKGFIPQLSMEAAVDLITTDEYTLTANVGSWSSFTSRGSGLAPAAGAGAAITALALGAGAGSDTRCAGASLRRRHSSFSSSSMRAPRREPRHTQATRKPITAARIKKMRIWVIK